MEYQPGVTPHRRQQRPSPRHLGPICVVSDLSWRVQPSRFGPLCGLSGLLPCLRGAALDVGGGDSGAKPRATSGHWRGAVSRGLVVCRVVSAVCFWFLAVGWCSPPFSFREVLSAAGWGLVAGALMGQCSLAPGARAVG